jgi:hypothetical protein
MLLTRLIAGQSGVISRDQAIDAGLTHAAVDRRIRLRRWVPLHPGVYLTDGHGYDDEARTRAAVLWAGSGAVLSGVAAAWWHGLVADAPAAITVTVPHDPSRRPGVVARAHRLPPGDVVEHRGLAVTAPALTVVEAALELGPAFLDGALRDGVGYPAVRAAHLRNRRAPGATTAVRMLRAAADRSAVIADAALVRLLRDAGVVGWRRTGPPGRPAVVFPAARVAVEGVGWAWRDHAPERPGWTVVRIPWTDLVNRPSEVVARIGASSRLMGEVPGAGLVSDGRFCAGSPRSGAARW